MARRVLKLLGLSALAVLLTLGAMSTPVQAQAGLIVQFLNRFIGTPHTWTATQTFASITVSSCTGCGTGGGTIAQWVRGDGTNSQTMDTGSIAASAPWHLTSTWNNAGVTFETLDVDITNTASASSSLPVAVRVSGQNGGNPVFSVSRGGTVILASVTQQSGGTSNGGLSWTGNSIVLSLDGNGKSMEVLGGTPTISSGFGGSPALVGNPTKAVGRVDVGTGGVATSGVIAASGIDTTNYTCVAEDETTAILTRATPGANIITLTGASAWTAHDFIAWHCFKTN